MRLVIHIVDLNDIVINNYIRKKKNNVGNLKLMMNIINQ